MGSFRCLLQCGFHLIVSSSQPNTSAQAASCSSPAPQPSACCSGPNTRTTHEPFPCLWSSAQPLSRLRCATNPLSPRPTHQRLQQPPGSLQCTPTDPLPASPRPARCTQVRLPVTVWLPVHVCVCIVQFVLHCICDVLSLTSHPPPLSSVTGIICHFSLSPFIPSLYLIFLGIHSLLTLSLCPHHPSFVSVGLFWFLHCLFVSTSHPLFCIFSPRCSRRPPGAPSHRPTIIRPAEPSLLD